jgi:hypothetical protein
MTPLESASALLQRYPLNAWDRDTLADLYHQILQTPYDATEGNPRAWWLAYLGQEMDRRTPPPWWPAEWEERGL